MIIYQEISHANKDTAHTKPRSNMSAPFVETVLRTRMRRSAIRTRYTFAVIRGLALPCLVSTARSMSQPIVLGRRTLVATAARNLSDQDVAQPLVRRDTPQTKIGMSEFGICRRCTSSGSATHRRSSTGRTTSASTLSTATRGLAGNGRTCWRILACWKRTRHRGEHITRPLMTSATMQAMTREGV